MMASEKPRFIPQLKNTVEVNNPPQVISFSLWTLKESLILAQDERWRRA